MNLIVYLQPDYQFRIEWEEDFFKALERAYKGNAHNLISLTYGDIPTHVYNKYSIRTMHEFYIQKSNIIQEEILQKFLRKD